jgi:hypothetical protein
VFAKYEAARAREREAELVAADDTAGPPAADGPWTAVATPDDDEAVSPAVVVGRGVVWAALAAWTVAFATHSVASNYAGESFLHLVNLVFHEAGHVLFSPFGRFMTVGGGSLLQVLVPLACAVAFWRSANPFGVAVAVWWTGQSLVDLAPYIADAQALRLVLLGGRTGAEVDGHDWEYLLTTLGMLHRARPLGAVAHVAGLLVMGGALAFGAAILARQWRLARATGSDGATPHRPRHQ